MKSKDYDRLLKLAASSLVLGEIPREDVGRFALELLESGAAGWRMASLASTKDTYGQSGDLEMFQRAIEEEGMSLPSRQKAIEYVVEHFCQEISNGLTDPLVALLRISSLIVSYVHPIPQPMREFIWIYNEYHEELRNVIDEASFLRGSKADQMRKDVLAAARDYLANYVSARN
jgi:hypothetical protein